MGGRHAGKWRQYAGTEDRYIYTQLFFARQASPPRAYLSHIGVSASRTDRILGGCSWILARQIFSLWRRTRPSLANLYFEAAGAPKLSNSLPWIALRAAFGQKAEQEHAFTAPTRYRPRTLSPVWAIVVIYLREIRLILESHLHSGTQPGHSGKKSDGGDCMSVRIALTTAGEPSQGMFTGGPEREIERGWRPDAVHASCRSPQATRI